jgi:predicted metal-dependent hydrolase
MSTRRTSSSTLPLVALRAAVEVLTSVLGDPDIEAELVVEILDVIHWYDVDPQNFIQYVENFHNEFGLDIWITEYACQNFTTRRRFCEGSRLRSAIVDSSSRQIWRPLTLPLVALRAAVEVLTSVLGDLSLEPSQNRRRVVRQDRLCQAILAVWGYAGHAGRESDECADEPRRRDHNPVQ